MPRAVARPHLSLVTGPSAPPTTVGGESDERELLIRLAASDVGALDEVLAWLRKPLTSYLISLLGSHDQAEDVAQETFCRLWDARARLRPEGSLRGFVYQVARNLAIAEQRRLQVHHRAAELLRADSLPHVVYEPPGDTEHPALAHAVRHLPTRRREIVILHAVHGLSYKEIGQLMGIAPQTVANQFSSALATLRRALIP